MNTLQNLRARIEQEADVKRLLKLEPLANGAFRYLIETPFETFPKFVIGTTDALNQSVRIEMRCGALWNAEEHWARLMENGVEMKKVS
jgi:hypothetical protein